MNYKLKEILLGIVYGIITMLFMLGLLPWALASSIIGCLVAMLAILRIRKRKNAGEKVACFTVSYMAVIIICMLIINSVSISS